MLVHNDIHNLMPSSAKTVTAYLKEVPTERIEFNVVESILRATVDLTDSVC